MSDKPALTPRKVLAEAAKEHYEELAKQAGWHNSIIPEAIDAWERERDLIREVDRLALANKELAERITDLEIELQDWRSGKRRKSNYGDTSLIEDSFGVDDMDELFGDTEVE